MQTTEPNRDRFSVAAIEDDNCRHIAALAGTPFFDDVATTDGAPLNYATLVKVRRGDVGGVGVRT